MKSEFLKGLSIDEDVISKIMAENGKDIEREKAKATDLSDKLTSANSKISEYEGKIRDLEISTASAEQYKKDLEDLKAKIKADEEKLESEQADKSLTDSITTVFGDKKFTSDYVKNGIIADMKAEISKAENQGKGYTELFENLTKDKDGIFANENPINMTGINPNANGYSNDDNIARSVMGLPPLK